MYIYIYIHLFMLSVCVDKHTYIYIHMCRSYICTPLYIYIYTYICICIHEPPPRRMEPSVRGVGTCIPFCPFPAGSVGEDHGAKISRRAFRLLVVLSQLNPSTGRAGCFFFFFFLRQHLTWGNQLEPWPSFHIKPSMS